MSQQSHTDDRSHSQKAPSVQPTDRGSVDEAIERKRERRVLERIEEDNREIESVVRQLLAEADDALAGESNYDPREVLETIHYYLNHDDRIDRLLHPNDDRLDRQTKVNFQKHRRDRENGIHPPPEHEYKTAVKVAKGLRYIYAYKDTTRYVPVRMERLDLPGAKSTKEGEITPVGRRRIGKAQKLDETEEEVLINHDDCEHVLVIALPRKGKDSTIVNIAGNLKDEHGYKWFSCLDDGRNETPMIGIPNDEQPIKENLEKFSQHPKAYDTRVYVPDTSGVPDVLPSNFKRFTIGIDTLTPRLILRLAGVTTDDANTMRRIGQALEETKMQSGGVEKLVELLNEYADEVEATITVTELVDDEFENEDGHDVIADADQVEQDHSIREHKYEMPADDVLETCAQSLMMLAGEGLIGDPGDESNLDIVEELAAQDRVAILNCNFLEPRNEALKYVLLNLWLRLIFNARDEHSRLPRAMLEIRELKDIAPSVMGNARFNREIKALRNTIYEIATRGGSRRILMLGSTQKLNDIYKAIRTNMPVKILLQLGEEEIMTLDRSYDFSNVQMDQLKSFDVGWGMLLTDGDAYWPIQWRGARCGLGLGDEDWRDRYAKAWGARVRQGMNDGWKSEHGDSEYWIQLRTGTVKRLDVDDDAIPELGEWHLTLEDVLANTPVTIDPDAVEPGQTIDDRVLEAALQARRDHEIPSDLSLSSSDKRTHRDLSFAGSDEAQKERKRRILQQEGVPKPLEDWAGTNKAGMREKLLAILHAIEHDDRGELTSVSKVADASGVPQGTASHYFKDGGQLERCVTKNDGVYQTTAIGSKALEVDWDELDEFF